VSQLSPRPLISVGMPVRDNAATLDLAVRSILAQTYDEIELLLIDDGSTDGTLDLMRRYEDPRVRVISDGESLGLPTRLNQAVAFASGELFARMDGDDVSYPERFERQVAALRKQPDLDLCGASLVVYRAGHEAIGVRRSPTDHDRITARPATGFPMAHPTFMGRIGFFRRWPYRRAAVSMEDQDLLLRSYRDSRFGNVPEILFGYRETELKLSKILKARRYMALRFGQELIRQGQPRQAVRAVAEQGAKAIYDSLAIGLHLDYRLLSHRAGSISGSEQAAWSAVLAGLGVEPSASASPAHDVELGDGG